MKRVAVLSVVVFVLASAFVACGGGGGGNHGGGGGGGTTASAFSLFSPSSVFNRPFGAGTTQHAELNWSLIPTVHAQVQARIQTGNWQGQCDTIPHPEDFNLDQIEFVLYGAGKWDNANCAGNFFNFSADGAPIVNTASLGNLVVYVKGVGADARDGQIRVYRNGVVTPVTCSVGQGTTCRDVLGREPANADETLFITMTVKRGHNYQRVKALLGEL